MIGLIILGIVILLIIYAISIQRNLVGLAERRLNALSMIGVQQESRWDALRQLAKTVKSYAGHEADTLLEVISARTGHMPITAEEVEKNESLFQQAMKEIKVVVEKYPELKADRLYEKLMDDINGYEEHVRKARMVYNDTTTKLNSAVRMFPSSIFARMFGFTTEAYLQTPQQKTEMPELDI